MGAERFEFVAALLEQVGAPWNDSARVFDTPAGIDIDFGGIYVQIRDGGLLLVDEHVIDLQVLIGMLQLGVREFMAAPGDEVLMEDSSSSEGAEEEAVDAPVELPEVPLAVVKAVGAEKIQAVTNDVVALLKGEG